ncbi:MAG: flagellar biosynthesis protein FlhF [Bdellovibrionales bacterium]|nr:flagellar biosynthesis protein FlhF [Bdellovibrionales bacterium]
MLVRKFEAKSMNEALKMIKTQLGPEAIILSARDNNKRFGIGGESSVEITAAIAEDTYKKKMMAESRLTDKGREQFHNTTAKYQKSFITKVTDSDQKKQLAKNNISSRRYIDIPDEDEQISLSSESVPQLNNDYQNLAGLNVEEAIQNPQTSNDQSSSDGLLTQSQGDRIKTMASKAFNDFQKSNLIPDRKIKASENNQKIQTLENEIYKLRAMLKKFQSVPQTFVASYPGADLGISYELSGMYDKLIGNGVAKDLTVNILKLAQQKLPKEHLKKKAYIDAWVAKHFMSSITVKNELDKKYQVFIGPPGGGKTASLVKLASDQVIRHKKKIAIITTDAFKVGASEQLKIFAQILNVPFAILRSPDDWKTVEDKLGHLDHIFVDSPGMNLKSNDEFMFLNAILPSDALGVNKHYVESVLSKDTDVVSVANRFRELGFNDVIFTKLDETSQHGVIYNFQKMFDKPLHSFGIGSKIPEDFELATKERVIDLIFKLTKFRRREANE